MNILTNSLILEKIYEFSDLKSKEQLEKYAKKEYYATCDSLMIDTIKHFQGKNKNNLPLPCFLCMWQVISKNKSDFLRTPF